MESELDRQAAILFGERPPLPAPDVAAVEPGQAIGDGDTPGGRDGQTAAAAAADKQPPRPVVPMTSRQQRNLWRHVKAIDNFWETLEECEPGMVARLAVLAAERRWEIIFLTTRPASAGDPAQVQTQRWLASKGFALPSVFVVARSRGRIAVSLGLDIVVDDRPEGCLDVVVESKARAILVWRADQMLVPGGARRLGIGVVATVSQCLDALADLETMPERRVDGRADQRRPLNQSIQPEPFDATRLDVGPPVELND
jgi:hypothetical protein